MPMEAPTRTCAASDLAAAARAREADRADRALDRKVARDEAGIRLEKLRIAAEFLGALLPSPTILAEANEAGVQAVNMLDEMPARLANPVARALMAASEFVAREFAAPPGDDPGF